jgi:hypothetical protein
MDCGIQISWEAGKRPGRSCRTCNESKYGMDSVLKKGKLDPREISAKKISQGRQDQQDYQDRKACGRGATGTSIKI